MNELIMDALIVGAVAGAIAGEGRREAAPSPRLHQAGHKSGKVPLVGLIGPR